MEWYHVLAMILGNLAVILPLWLWNRTESRADSRHMDNKIDAIRELTHAIHLEMKDFHARLEKQDSEFKFHLLNEHRIK